MIDEKLSPLLDRLLEVSIEWLKANGYDNVDKVYFSADGLIAGMKYGIDSIFSVTTAAGSSVI